MKFLVLALCVCAASAASFGGYSPYKPYQASKAVANAAVDTALLAPKAVVNAAQFVASAPVVASKAIYEAGKEGAAAVLRADSEVGADGFKYLYETSNGIYAEATGYAKKVNNEDVFAVQGAYKYIAPDGTPVQFTYIADENGYQPQSDLIPVAPPVPEAIVRSLEYLRTHAPVNPEKY